MERDEALRLTLDELIIRTIGRWQEKDPSLEAEGKIKLPWPLKANRLPRF